MQLNTIKPAEGAKKERRRVGRGIGSGFGKTSGRGHKGQKSRTGGFHKVGFEGGQSMTKAKTPHVRTSELSLIPNEVIDLLALKAANIVSGTVTNAKIFLSGDVTAKFNIQGLLLTKGARAAVEAAGGKILEAA